jgi:hypothetical protein
VLGSEKLTAWPSLSSPSAVAAQDDILWDLYDNPRVKADLVSDVAGGEGGSDTFTTTATRTTSAPATPSTGARSAGGEADGKLKQKGGQGTELGPAHPSSSPHHNSSSSNSRKAHHASTAPSPSTAQAVCPLLPYHIPSSLPLSLTHTLSLALTFTQSMCHTGCLSMTTFSHPFTSPPFTLTNSNCNCHSPSLPLCATDDTSIRRGGVSAHDGSAVEVGVPWWRKLVSVGMEAVSPSVETFEAIEARLREDMRRVPGGVWGGATPHT